jgi:hypothetical protein
VSYKPGTGRQNRRLSIEALTFGLAYGAGLCWASVCLLASFRPAGLSAPYWSAVPDLRSDTAGVLAFFAVALSLTCSEFLRLSRQRVGLPVPDGAPGQRRPAMALLAAAETGAILATGLVLYLSVNTITHPATLNLPATHLAPWPTEGTLRVIALLLCVWSAGQLRAGRARADDPLSSASGPVAGSTV